MSSEPNNPQPDQEQAHEPPPQPRQHIRGSRKMAAKCKITQATKNRIAKLYGDSWTMTQIAKELKVSLSTVWKYVSEAKTEWKLARVEAIERIRARELGKLDMLEDEAIQAWEHSQKDDAESGDPRFLAQIERCIKSRRELLGLDAPVKTDAKVEHGGNVLFGALTPEQMKQEILERIAAAGATVATSSPATGNDSDGDEP